jgi:hypothetical protein
MAGAAPGGGAAGGGAGGAAGGVAGGGEGGTAGTSGGGGAGGAACDTNLGKAMKFTGAVDMVAGDLGADSTFGNGPRTLELWAKFEGPDSWKAEGSIIELGKPSGNNKVWGIDMSGRNGTAGVFGPYVNGVSDNNGINAPPQLADTPENVGWLHLSWAYEGNGGKLEFTVDGKVLPTEVPVAGFMLDTSPGYVLLGASQNFGNQGWTGVMDEVRIWNVYKTPQQITDGMKQIMKPDAANLVAYYQFNEGTGGDVGDSTGKATHKLSLCTAAAGACPAANAAMPTWVDSDVPGPFTCAP